MFDGDEQWRALPAPTGERFTWVDTSTYIRKPPFLEGVGPDPAPPTDIEGARVLALLGDSVTTDHISPAGVIRRDGPAAKWLLEHDVPVAEFNSYGARRGQPRGHGARHVRATCGCATSSRPGTEGGVTVHLPDGDPMTIYDASMRYAAEGVPLVVLAGKEYGSGSSRDWAAKGSQLLGVRAVIAESFERIHRSNLVGMGVLPLQFAEGESAATLGLTGHEVFRFVGVDRPRRGRSAASHDPGVRPTDRSSRRSRASTRRSSGTCSSRAGSCRTPCGIWPSLGDARGRLRSSGRPRCVSLTPGFPRGERRGRQTGVMQHPPQRSWSIDGLGVRVASVSGVARRLLRERRRRTHAVEASVGHDASSCSTSTASGSWTRPA